MKRFCLFLFALSAVYGQATAQSWTASALGSGQFYLYNVGANGFLVGANDWGTLASITSSGGVLVTLSGSGNSYTISTAPDYPGCYLGTWGYVDSESATWTIESVVGQSNVYTLKTYRDSEWKYLYADASSTKVNVGAAPSTNYVYWKLVSKENRIAEMKKSASDNNPIDATFLITNPNFSRNIPTDNYGWTMNASNQNLSGGKDDNRCAESWHSSFTLSQTVSAPNGRYKLRAQAALKEDGGNVTGRNFAVVYLNDATVSFKTMQSDLNSMEQLSDKFTAGEYYTNYTDIVEITDGRMTIGVRGTRNDTWCIWDNFQLQYCGEIDLSSFEAGLAAKVAEAEALSGTIPDVAYSSLMSVVNAQNKTYNSGDEYSAAIQTIDNAIGQYASESIKTAYASFKSYLSQANSLLNTNAVTYADDAKVTLGNAIASAETTANSTSASTIEDAISNLRYAARTFLSSVTIVSAIDITPWWITNPEPYADGTGWTFTDGTHTTEWASSAASFDPANRCAEMWANQGASFKQILSDLPAGSYRLTAVAFTRSGINSTLSAGSTSKNLVGVPDNVNDRDAANTWFNAGNGVNVLDFTLETQAYNLPIGITAGTTSDAWTVWRSFKLECLSATGSIAPFIVDGIRYEVTSTEDLTATVAHNSDFAGGKAIIQSLVEYKGKEYMVTEISSVAFNGCSGLTSVSIPNSVTKIGNYVFSGCSSLTSVICYANTIPSTPIYAFSGSNYENSTLYVPASVFLNYKKTVPWSEFGSIETINGEEPEMEKCATPSISYVNGNLTFNCDTEGVEYVYEITFPNTLSINSKEVTLSDKTILVTVYAKKEDYKSSDVVTKAIPLTGDVQCDIDGDGRVTDSDVTRLVDIVLGKEGQQ